MRSYILILSLLFVLFGCSDDQNGDRLNEKSNSLSVVSVSTQNVQTRSTTPLKKDSIGLFLRPGNGYVEQANVKYRYNASSSAWETLTPLYLGSHNASVCAYYPYSSSVTDAEAVPLVSKEYTSEADFCYAANEPASSSAPNVSFTMKHAYARISFHITRGTSYTGSSAINYISIKNDSSLLLRSAMLNIAEGTLTNPSLGTFSFDPEISGIASGGTVVKQVLLVPVNAVSGKITFTFKVDGQTMSANADVATYGLSSLAAGYDYKVGITISGSSLSLNGVSVSDWTDESSIDSNMLNDVQPESNCYIVKPNSYINIPVSRAKSNPSISTLPTSWTTGLVWTDYPNPLTSNGTIEKITGNVANQIITIKTGSAEGNAVIYIKNSSNVIIWSWHIWVTSYDPNSVNYSYNNNVWMDRNLGATTNGPKLVTTLGLLYEWGRKDPFPNTKTLSTAAEPTLYNTTTASTELVKKVLAPSTSVTNGNIVLSIANPLNYYYGTSATYSDWYGNSSAYNNNLWLPSAKTAYDPCPLGWRIPPSEGYSGLTTSNFAYLSSNLGRTYNDAIIKFYFPFTAYRYSRGGNLVWDDYGRVQTSTALATGYSIAFFFSTTSLDPPNNRRAVGAPVRCVKEE